MTVLTSLFRFPVYTYGGSQGSGRPSPVTAQPTAYVADDFRRSSPCRAAKPVGTSAFCLSSCTNIESLGDSRYHLGFSTKTCSHSIVLANGLTEGSCGTEMLSQGGLAAKAHPGINTRS